MNLSPTKTDKRIQELDLFRGFAILGIFMVNILVMNVSFVYRFNWEAEQTGWLQEISFFVLETFFYSKFFAIFSLLFGVGVALQIQRMKERGTFQNSFFLRRFGSLFLFGILHILFIWSGDILHLYGLMGFALLLFFRGSARFLLWSAIVVFAFPFYGFVYQTIIDWLSLDYSGLLPELSREAILELKHHGSYSSGIVLRLKEYGFAMELILAGIAPVAFSMMLLGGYFVKKGWLNNLYDRLIKVRFYLFGFLLILVTFRFILIYGLLPNFEIPRGSALSIFFYTMYQLSDVSLSLSFLWILGYCWNKGYFQWILTQLQFVGKMAFTNYILQSILGYIIMRTLNGYEFFSVFQCILLVLGIYIIQIIFSKWWLSKYLFGPLEWIWRCISYWKILPIRLS